MSFVVIGRRVAAICLLPMSLAAPTELHGQRMPTVESSDSDAIPFTLPTSEGFSSTTIGGERAALFLIRPRIEMQSLEDNAIAMRLRLGLQFSFRFDGLSKSTPSSLRVVSVLPGIEAIIPVGSHSLLRPYMDLGVGKVTEDRTAALFGTGLTGEFVFPWDRLELGLEPGFEYRRGLTGLDIDETGVSDVFLYGDARYPLGFDVGGSQPDVGVYLRQTFLLRTLELASTSGDPFPVREFSEVGVILGFRRRPKVWFFRLPTLGIGYRFGDLNGLTFRIGGDRLVRLADPPLRPADRQ